MEAEERGTQTRSSKFGREPTLPVATTTAATFLSASDFKWSHTATSDLTSPGERVDRPESYGVLRT